MEGTLSSGRYDRGGSSSHRGSNNDYYGSSHHHRGGGGRGGRGRGRGRYNNRHHPYGGGRHGGGGRRYNDRYEGGGRRGGGGGGGGGGRHHNRGPRQPANRFTTETKSVDPQHAMMKQLTAMVAKMGDLKGAAEVAASNAAANADAAMDADKHNNLLRPVVKAIGMNVSDLVEVLCGAQNAQLFLKFGDDNDAATAADNNNEVGDMAAMNLNNDSEAKEENVTVINATKQAGALSTLLVSCAYGLPLQTPSYAALTLGVDVKAPKETHAGFAGRCVDLAMRCLGRDLDMALECTVTSSGTKSKGDDGITIDENEKDNVRCFAERTGGFGNRNQIDAYYRAKFLLRYLAYLSKIGIVAAEDGGDQSFLGLLQMLAQAATSAAQASSANGNDEKKRALGRASRVLASLILSVLPFAMNTSDGGEKGLSSDTISDLVDVIENNVVGQASNYSSDYCPGIGPLSILLKGELDDAPLAGGMEEEEEDDDDDDDDDGDQPAPCADTLQDLLRTVRKLISPSSSTRFALLGDSPWLALTMDSQSPDMGELEKVPMEYSGDQLLLDLVGGEEFRCKSIPYLMSLDNADDSVEIICRSLDGIVFGRLAIFDAPSEGEDDEEEEEEDAEETNPNLESFTKSYSLADRFFLADAIRDVLMCHRPMVSDAGADRNNAKEVADQIWAISHLFIGADSNEDSTSSKGIEFGIVETIISLIVQCTPQGSGMPSSSPLNELVYLSRVLLELTKLMPSLVPQAIVLAVSGMFEDFMPSLTTTARENLGHWLSFHLTNTDYQWPKSYWEHWAPYAAAGQRNSRGDFVSTALWSMATLSPEGPEIVARECLPAGSTLVQSVFLKHAQTDTNVDSTENDLINRIWDTSEDPDSIRQHIISDELSESYGSTVKSIDGDGDNSMSQPKVWWRTRLATRTLFHPLSRENSRMIALAEKAWKKKASAGDGNDMEGEYHAEEGKDETEDILADLTDAIARFKPVLLAAVARDADAYDSEATGKVDDDKLLLAGEVSILSEIGGLVSAWDSTATFSLIECLMKNQIVSSLSVATWALGDNKEVANVSPQWWKVVSLALNNAVTNALSRADLSQTDLGGGIGMIIDDAAASDGVDSIEADIKRMDESLKAAVPVLKYSLERVCHLVSTTNSAKKIPISAADLTEGMKRLSRAVLFQLSSLASLPSPSLTLNNLHRGLMSMDFDGEKLASACQAVECDGEQERKLLQHVAFSVAKLF